MPSSGPRFNQACSVTYLTRWRREPTHTDHVHGTALRSHIGQPNWVGAECGNKVNRANQGKSSSSNSIKLRPVIKVVMKYALVD